MKSWPKPTDEQIERAVSLLGRHQQRRYFFDRLENPEWLAPLRKRGVFSQPPQAVVDESGTTYPPWPESKYLMRMVSEMPQLVSDIILELPDTNNALVHLDLIDAAMGLPPDLAAKWAAKEANWLQRNPEAFFPLPDRFGDLLVRLAQTGHLETSLQFARALLNLLPDVRAPTSEDSLLSPEPRTRFDDWEYYEILRTHVPLVVRAGGVPALAMLSDLLEKAIELSRRGNAPSTWEDYSFVWRPSIEVGEENLPGPYGGIKDALVSAVRDAALEIAGLQPSQFRELVTLLERRPWRVFHRISLHLLRVAGAPFPDLIAERLTDRNRFDDSGCRHEYALLARENYSRLESHHRNVILGWIDRGPDVDVIRRWLGRGTSTPNDDDIAREASRWRRDRLAVLRDSLPHEWAEKYRALCRELGEPQFHEFPITSGELLSPKPAKLAPEMRAMVTEDLVAFLAAEVPSEKAFDQRAALGSELKECVAAEPARFSLDATRFKGLAAIFVSNVIAGFREAVAKQVELSWETVLELFEWVVEQPLEETAAPSAYRDQTDDGWRWSRHEIAHLLFVGLQIHDGKAPIPFSLRDRVWHIAR